MRSLFGIVNFNALNPWMTLWMKKLKKAVVHREGPITGIPLPPVIRPIHCFARDHCEPRERVRTSITEPLDLPCFESLELAVHCEQFPLAK
jgi:hypothetical protein